MESNLNPFRHLDKLNPTMLTNGAFGLSFVSPLDSPAISSKSLDVCSERESAVRRIWEEALGSKGTRRGQRFQNIWAIKRIRKQTVGKDAYLNKMK